MRSVGKTSRTLKRLLRRRRGFTLLELVVVIGIILVLMSLVLAVSTVIIQQAETRQLETVFANLESSVTEYEQAIGRKITYEDRSDETSGGGAARAWDVPFDVPLLYNAVEMPYNMSINSGIGGYTCNCASTNDQSGWERYIVRLLQLLERTDGAEEILARIDPNLLVQIRRSNGQPLPDGFAMSSIVDPWGTPLAVVFPGRMWREGDTQIRDSDGTIRTYIEDKMGICKDAIPLFVSAGPDGDIGCVKCVDGGNTSPRYQASIDNVYSYVPEGR